MLHHRDPTTCQVSPRWKRYSSEGQQEQGPALINLQFLGRIREIDKKRTEFLTTQENRVCSSPVKSLLDLFQTSEEKSEFLGFTSYTEKNNICDVLDILEEENSNLLTMFFSSPSTSTFTGF